MPHKPSELARVYAWFSDVSTEDTELLSDLLAYGVPIDIPHPLRHSTALMEATRWGCTGTVQWLLEHGATPAFLGGSPSATALHSALMHKRWEIATILTQVMDTCDMIDANGATVLHALCAASYDQPDAEILLGLATVFIGKSCPLDALDHEGTTALHHCVINDQLALAELLLEHGANANARIPDSGVSPLIIAALDKNMEMAQLLMHHGADVTLATRDGSTATAIYPQIAAAIKLSARGKSTPTFTPKILA